MKINIPYGKQNITKEDIDSVSKALSGVKKSKEHCKALSLAQKGKKHDSPSTEVRLKMSLAQKGKTQRTLSCPHCSKTGGYAAIKRWHFDNCKGKICL